MARPRKIKQEDSNDNFELNEDDLYIGENNSEILEFMHENEILNSQEDEYGEVVADASETKTPKRKTLSKRPKSTTTKGHYVTNADLLPAVIEAKKLGYMTNELARMIMLIATNYSKKNNFIGYSFRDDMVSFALVNLMANGLKFNPEKSNNPFAFYTTAIHRSFLQYLADEAKHRNVRDELIMREGFNPSNSYLENSKEDTNNDY